MPKKCKIFERFRLQTQKLAPHHCEFLATHLVPFLVKTFFLALYLICSPEKNGGRGSSPPMLKIGQNWDKIANYPPQCSTKICTPDSKSRKQLIDCSVAQGSSLDPLLFLLYVNDIPQMSQLLTTLFADDILLSLSDANLSRLENRVNMQLQYIAQWLNQNKLTLNSLKTTYLLFKKQPHGRISLKGQGTQNQCFLSFESF